MSNTVEPDGTYACPQCGADYPHYHDALTGSPVKWTADAWMQPRADVPIWNPPEANVPGQSTGHPEKTTEEAA